MSQPLGRAIGNALDVAEGVRLLRGEERGNLRELSVQFVTEALVELAGQDPSAARAAVERALDEGAAAETFGRMIEAQGGDPGAVDHPEAILPRAPVQVEVMGKEGFVASIDAEALGRIALRLGAGRVKKGDAIDPAVGLEFDPKVGDRVERDHVVAMVHARSETEARAAAELVPRAYTVVEERVDPPSLVHGWFSTEREGPEREGASA
jgi:thymidine phosphorylase